MVYTVYTCMLTYMDTYLCTDANIAGWTRLV